MLTTYYPAPSKVALDAVDLAWSGGVDHALVVDARWRAEHCPAGRAGVASVAMDETVWPSRATASASACASAAISAAVSAAAAAAASSTAASSATAAAAAARSNRECCN